MISGRGDVERAIAVVEDRPDHRRASVIFRTDVTVRLVKSAACDADVVFAARVSVDPTRSLTYVEAGFGPLPAADEGLVRFLLRNRHGTPFEHNSMTFFVEAPIFVFREFHRHRVGFSYNEESARYRELRPVFYVPGDDRDLGQEGKPGHYVTVPGTSTQRSLVASTIRARSVQAYAAYEDLLREGVAREVARMVLPVNVYSSMYVTTNARALMNLLSLRTHRDHARFPSFPMREIELVAKQMERHWATLMPVTHREFDAFGRVAP